MANRNKKGDDATVVTPPPQSDIEILREHLQPKYNVDGKLGSGGMADVYLGFHNLLKRKVAIKVLPKAFSRDEGMVERFLREAESAAQLDHPGIISIYDIGVAGPLNYFIMAYVPGDTLKSRLSKSGKLEVKTASRIIAQVCRALQYAHDKGVVHRDIKPDNIMFNERGDAVITDFGIAKAKFASKMTATGTLIGTPHYMSPEQLKGHEVDGRSDLYSLGILFYEILVGRVPFEGDDTYAVGLKHIQEAPVPPIELNNTIPKHINDLILTMLAKTPDARFQNAADVEATLMGLLAEGAEEKAALDVAERVSGQAQKAVETWRLQRTQVQADFERMKETLGEVSPGETPPPLDKVEELITEQQEAGLYSTPPPLTRPADTPPPMEKAPESLSQKRGPSFPGSRGPWRNLKPIHFGLGAVVILVVIVVMALMMFNRPGSRGGNSGGSGGRSRGGRVSEPSLSPEGMFQGRSLLFAEGDGRIRQLLQLESPLAEPSTFLEDSAGTLANIMDISYFAGPDGLLIVRRDGSLTVVTLSGRQRDVIWEDPLGNRAGIRSASMSRDGKYVTFVRRADNRYQLHVIPAGSSRVTGVPRPVFDYPGELVSPAFSPVESRQIAFGIIDDSLKIPSIIALQRAGEDTWTPLHETDGRIRRLAWAPDGRAIAYSLLLSGETSIHILDIETESTSRLADEAYEDSALFFSPDGRFVIFASDREGGRMGIWAVSREGGSPTRLTSRNIAADVLIPIGWR